MDGCIDSATARPARQVCLSPMTDERTGDRGSGAEQDEQVERIRRLLEEEIDRQIGPQRGCWPLLVAAAGVLLGIVLLWTGCP